MQPADRRAESASRWVLVCAWACAAYLAVTAYLAVESAPTLPYIASVMLHYFGGLGLAPLVAAVALRRLRSRGRADAVAGAGYLALAFLLGSFASALALYFLHNLRSTRWLLNLHIVLSGLAVVVGAVALILAAREGSALARRVLRPLRGGIAVAFAVALAIPLLGGLRSASNLEIRNPLRPPFEMSGEAMGGAAGPFFPSAAATTSGTRIRSDLFMSSESCARCHPDIVGQWKSSAHRFSSFNNQWYRKSIEYMQEVNSVQSSKWCGGCHDHAVLFNGMMDTPIKAIMDSPEAHNGLGCNSCHAIVRVHDTAGNGGFTLQYPPLHDLAASDNPLLRWLHDTAVRLDPGPHREVFLKPFHRQQHAEFCSACHKVHLDLPVNNYRWLRGFNEYDNWQASGVSGQGARSFYYPPRSMDCVDCHMPRVPSKDRGEIGGQVHDHSFVAANTALPVANLDESQLVRTIEFLQAGQLTVDVFAAGPAGPREAPAVVEAAPESGTRLASTFAVGEEASPSVGPGRETSRQPGPLWAPLDRFDVPVRRGEEVRVDVVVRTRGLGHFFPGGTVDAFDAWLELRAQDSNGRTLFWSGVVHDGGLGPVDPGSHFYGVRLTDAHGNPINKRNAWAARALAWVNLIPPGAADAVHFRLAVPEDCGDTITLEARLNYRKFTHGYTEFSFAGRPAPGEPERPGADVERVTPHWDDRRFEAGPVPQDVSAVLREIPVLPIVVLARGTAQLTVLPADAVLPEPALGVEKQDAPRWNDYGIGLLQQGDLAAARRAFRQVTRADPAYADGFVNLARVALREGLLEEAEPALQQALACNPELAKTHYFMGVLRKEQGRYDEALTHLRRAAVLYPRDRVVRNAVGRVLFLQRRYLEAVEELQKVVEIDSEDLMAHYNLMLCYRGLGRHEEADAERRLYERFKADESAQSLLNAYLRESPEDNRMRQAIHEQASVPREVIEREVALRDRDGDPHVVLPGQAPAYARRVVERGRQLLASGAERGRSVASLPPDTRAPAPPTRRQGAP